MNFPGFTAQVSLYQSGGYRRVASRGTGWSASGVVPQLPRQLNLLQCLQGCSVAGAGDECVNQCYWKENIGATDDFGKGGNTRGPAKSPDIVCGPCRRGRQTCFLPGVGTGTGPCID